MLSYRLALFSRALHITLNCNGYPGRFSDFQNQPKHEIDPIYKTTKKVVYIRQVFKGIHIQNDRVHKLSWTIDSTFSTADLHILPTTRKQDGSSWMFRSALRLMSQFTNNYGDTYIAKGNRRICLQISERIPKWLVASKLLLPMHLLDVYQIHDHESRF